MQQEDIPCPYMSISDHLEMLGVELKATWSQTRKANCDISQTRIGNTIQQWKSGKFMFMNLRSWSFNQYCLPKMWFRSHCVDLRVQDVNKITSLVKSWLYQDQLLKPEELVMHRHPSAGGLGVHHVELKAQAGLIRTFLETASNPSFRSSLFHSTLYRYHILGETLLPNPGYPPFYNQDFFDKIRKVHLETPLNISKMSEKDWYRVLLEEYCTMEVDHTGQQVNIQCRVERASPLTDWEKSWRLARLPGLGPENVSFLFKLLHDLLPTQERVARTKPTASPACQLPGCNYGMENRAHALVFCESNNGVGQRVISCLQNFVPNIDVEAAIRLEIDIEEEMELPIVWMLATVFQAIWKLRVEKSRVLLYDVRAQLEARINLLRETRHSCSATRLDQIVENFFY